MKEWELRVSQGELHRIHVVRLVVEGRKAFRDLSSSDEAVTAQDERARS